MVARNQCFRRSRLPRRDKIFFSHEKEEPITTESLVFIADTMMPLTRTKFKDPATGFPTITFDVQLFNKPREWLKWMKCLFRLVSVDSSKSKSCQVSEIHDGETNELLARALQQALIQRPQSKIRFN